MLQIHQLKTRRVAARHQAAQIDPQDVVRLLTAAFGKLNSSEPLSFSSSTLRKRFSMLQAALGLPTRRSAEVAPYDLASLRPGGATRLLHQFEDAEFVRRRGHWLSSRVCEINLQEVAVVTHQTRISATARSRISELVKAYLEILEKTIRMLDSFIPLSAWPHLW